MVDADDKLLIKMKSDFLVHDRTLLESRSIFHSIKAYYG